MSQQPGTPRGIMSRLSRGYERLLDALVLVACLLLLLMALMIGADVLLRNIGAGGVVMSNELSEDFLYLITLLAAPWLLRQGQHIRVDIILQMLPVRIAWLLEWVGDIAGFVCCLFFLHYGWTMTAASYAAGSLSIKTLVYPEWWILVPLPIGFALLAIEFVFRMHRLATGEQKPRTDAVSAA